MKFHPSLLLGLYACMLQGVHSIFEGIRPVSLKHLDDVHDDICSGPDCESDHRIFQLNVPYGASANFAARESARLDTLGIADSKMKAKELVLRKHFRRSLRKAKTDYIKRLTQIREAKLHLK